MHSVTNKRESDFSAAESLRKQLRRKTLAQNKDDNVQGRITIKTPTSIDDSDIRATKDERLKSHCESIQSIDDEDDSSAAFVELDGSKSQPECDDVSTPNNDRHTGQSDVSPRNYNSAMRRLLEKPRNTDSIVKEGQRDDSNVSFGERLRGVEFIGDDK